MLVRRGQQHTLENTVKIKGRGLHTGGPVSVTIKPAPEDSGFVFCRKDLPGEQCFKAGPDKVVDTNRSTTLGEGKCRVGTVEHFFAAVAVLKLDNLIVEIDGPEMPILDGSPYPFFIELKKGGKKKQEASRLWRKIEEPLFFRDCFSSIVALPAEGFRVTYVFIAPPPIGHQALDREENWEELLPARTFGWEEEAKELKKRGLARGGSEECAIIFRQGEEAPPYRVPNEPVVHKALDLIGDLALYRPVLGHFIAVRAGHKLHNQLARELQAGEG